jgi:hypothetical protein
MMRALMSKLLPAALLLLAATIIAAETPVVPFMTGNQWMALYETSDETRETAAAYVAGYVDGVRSTGTTARTKKLCVPDNVTELDLADAVAHYLSRKQAFMQMGAPFIVDKALREAYRC